MFQPITIEEATLTIGEQVVEFLSHTTTNSSVQNTNGLKLSPESMVICDWLQFHLPDCDDTWVFIDRWFPDFRELQSSRVPGYEKCAEVFSTGVIAWGKSRKDGRVFVRLPASALAMLNVEPVKFMQMVLLQRGSFSRVDFAMDSFGQLDILVMLEKLERHEVQTRWKSYMCEEGKKEIGTGNGEGLTVYVGDRRSESFLRVYDKTAEQKRKLVRSGASEEELAAIPENWVRVELESKKRKAQALGEALIESLRADKVLSQVITKHLLSLIDFKDKGIDSNRSRWLTCDWWVEFLEVVAKEAIKLPQPVYTLRRLFAWIEHISPALSVAASVDIDWLLAEIARARVRFRQKHKLLLDEAGIKFEEFETD